MQYVTSYLIDNVNVEFYIDSDYLLHEKATDRDTGIEIERVPSMRQIIGNIAWLLDNSIYADSANDLLMVVLQICNK